MKAILVAGLPGSGKSHHVGKLVRELDAIRFDDFKAHAKSLAFHDGLRLDELISALRSGKTCVIADIHFCNLRAREEAELSLRELVPGVEIEWQYFENDPEACRENVRKQKDRNPEERLQKIDEYTKCYWIPADITPIKVWTDSLTLR